MSNTKVNAEMIDDENPEWTDEMFSQATSFQKSDMPDSLKTIIRKGRPKSDNPKTPISIRLSSEVVSFFKATGKGWQTRMDEVLQNYVAKH